MIITSFSNRIIIAYCVYYLDAVPGIFEPKAVAVEDFAVADGMQVGEAFGELDLLSVNGDAAVGGFSGGGGGLFQVVAVDAQIPSHPCMFQLQETGGTVGASQVDDVFFSR